MKTILGCICLILFLPYLGKAQQVTISGHISNAINGKKIESVSVFERISGIGTISNTDGFFKLRINPGKREILFSDSDFQEFRTQFVAKSDSVINIKLQPVPVKSKNRKEIALEANSSLKNKGLQKRRFFVF